MVAIAFAAAAPALGLAGAGISTAATIAGIGLGLLAAYIDQAVTYPLLFGKRSQKPDALEGFQISTTDPGAPRWTVFGTRAWVPCHYLWSQNIREEVTGGTSGKGGGGRPFVQTVRADVGLAACDGPIKEIDTLYGDERPFWSKQFNRVVLEDHRWTISAGTGPEAGLLVIQATDADVADFAGIFLGGDAQEIAQLENVFPTAVGGIYRTVAVAAHSGTARARITLRPLQGQVPAAAVAGSVFEPSRLRRIDQGGAHVWNGASAAGNQLLLVGPTTTAGPGGLPLQVEPTLPVDDGTKEQVQKRWPIGGIFRLLQYQPGRWRLAGVFVETVGPPPTSNIRWKWAFDPLDNQPLVSSGPTGTASLPCIAVRDDSGGFTFYDNAQAWTAYPGSDVQDPDPTLAASQPNPPAHRGIAHISLANWNLGPHGNIFPRTTAFVRARSGETVAAAIQRICTRTMPAENVNVSRLRTKVLLGYSMPAGMTGIQALQPILAFNRVAVQDRGGVLTFLDVRDLPVVSVATRHLNARAGNEPSTNRGFVANRVDKSDAPERVVVRFLDPAEGADEAEGDGGRSPGSPDRGGRDTLAVDLRPLVVWPYEAKRRAREMRREIQLESYRGQVSLPPGYMDVLAGHVLTYVSNNHEDERLPGGATIAFDTRLRDILPESVALQVRWSNGQVATLVDDGNGKLQGFPAGISTFVNTVNYATGRVELLCNVALDSDHEPILEYRYEKQWLMRVNRAKFSGYDMTTLCDVVSTTRDDPLPPVPRDRRPGLGGALGGVVPIYRSHVLDLPSLFPGTRSVMIGVVAAPEPGGAWRGAIVYQSPNGVDRWSAIGALQAKSVIGTLAVNNLPTTLSGARTTSIDWTTEMQVELPDGSELASVTTDEIGWGANWLLVGDEVIGFHEAEADVGGIWKLRGLIRGMRFTDLAMDTHQVGERVVLLTAIGALHGLYHEAGGGLAAANRTYHFRIVPGGASIDQVSTISTMIRGNSARPARPLLEAGMLEQKLGGYVSCSWERRSQDQTTVFGPSPLLPGDYERYEVVAFNVAVAAGLIGSIGLEAAIEATATRRWFVGDPSMGTPLVERRIEYDEVEWLAHGYIPFVLPIGFVVYQIGAAGRSQRSDVQFLVPTI